MTLQLDLYEELLGCNCRCPAKVYFQHYILQPINDDVLGSAIA